MDAAGQKLIDRYLPVYSFKEYHQTVVNRSIERVHAAARNVDLSKSRLIRWLFKIRGLPTKRMHLQDFISDIGFTVLGENSPRENVIGFWARRAVEPITRPADFIDNTISARVKVAWNFYCEELDTHRVRLSTETRILCTTTAARVTFGLYWMIIRPFSGLIRIKMLQLIKEAAETMGRPDDGTHPSGTIDGRRRA